jgi:tRNA-dihydrouridine synthase C
MASGCHDLMIGRGMITHPGLGLAIKQFDALQDASANHLASHQAQPMTWQELQTHIAVFWSHVRQHISRRHQAGRLKQWLNFLRKHYPEAQEAYMQLRLTNNPDDFDRWLNHAYLEHQHLYQALRQKPNEQQALMHDEEDENMLEQVCA